MEWPDGSTAEVVGIGPNTFFYVEDGEDAAEWSCASDKIHHYKPTVKDVLDELVDKASSIAHAHAENDMGGKEMMDALQGLVAEFAAKFQLKED
jgi:hypothetical protein